MSTGDHLQNTAAHRAPAVEGHPWRHRLLNTVLLAAVVLGTLAYIPSALMAFDTGIISIVVLDTAAIVLVYGLYFLDRIPYTIRAGTLCAVIYCLGAWLLITVGTVSQIYLFGFAVFAGVLLGLRAGLAALCINGITLVALGFLGYAHREFFVPDSTNPFVEWLVIVVNFLLVNGGVTLSVSVLLDTLDSSLRRETQYRQELQEDHRKLREAHAGLEREVAERQRAETQARRLAAGVEQARQGIVLADGAGVTIYGNPAFSRLGQHCGAGDDFSLPGLLQRMVPPAALETVRQTVAAEGVWNAAARLLTPREESLHIDVEIRRLVEPDDEEAFTLIALVRDVTREKEMEHRLLHQQKLESVGTLAGGIAHDFNNILAAIMGSAELLRMEDCRDDERLELIGQIIMASSRARNLVQRILTFSRHMESHQIVVDLREAVEEAVALLRATLPATITIETHYGAEGVTIQGDPSQIHQIIMNLGTNAYHAMEPGGGILRIALAPGESTEKGGGEEPQWILLRVQDTGCGISEEIRARIFDPFFTTKEQGKGTGLGLSTVHGIVQGMGGQIRVDSGADTGTLFEILLPQCTRPDDVPQDGLPAMAPPGDGEHLLLVDDEEAIVHVTCLFLERSGYRVTGFTSPQEAIAAFSSAPGEYALLLTDQTMPGMTGLEMVRTMHGLRPNLPFVLCSGFSEDIEETRGDLPPNASFLQKPYSQAQLAAHVANVLRAHSPV